MVTAGVCNIFQLAGYQLGFNPISNLVGLLWALALSCRYVHYFPVGCGVPVGFNPISNHVGLLWAHTYIKLMVTAGVCNIFRMAGYQLGFNPILNYVGLLWALALS